MSLIALFFRCRPQERLEAAVAEAAAIAEAAAGEARDQLLAAQRDAAALREALEAALRAAEEQRGAALARKVRWPGPLRCVSAGVCGLVYPALCSSTTEQSSA